MKKLMAITLGVAGFMLLGWIAAWAAELPGAVLPGQIEQQFKKEPQIRAGQPERVVVPEVDQPVPSNARGIRFKLTKIVIEAVTVYSESELRSVYQDRLDQEVSLSEIYQIASSLTAKYRNDGYILSRIIVPVQSIEGGEVRLKAVEGYVARVTIDGTTGWRKLVQRYAAQITKSRPLKNSVLERYLLLMNDLPGAFARATIKPSPSEPGASEMIVEFTQSKVQGGLGADNRGGELLGPLRLSADLSFNSVLGIQESTALRGVSSGNDQLIFGSLVHEERIGASGGKLTLSGSVTKAKPKEILFIPLNLETSSQTGALAYSYPLIRSRSQNLFLRGSFTAHDGKTEIFGVEDTHDRIRAFRLGMTYDRADSLRGINLLDIEISQGINGLGSSDKDDPMLSRPNGRPDFTKATLYAARLQSLSERWSVLAAVNAQYAWTDLLSPELYSFGGEHFGRGYEPSELVGDHGVAGKLELRFTETLPLRFPSSFTFYGFYDVGIIYLRSPDGDNDSDSAASGGVGLRVNLGSYFSGFAEWAKPLTRDVSAKQSRDPRGYWGVSTRFNF